MNTFPVLVGKTDFPLRATPSKDRLPRPEEPLNDVYDHVVFDGPPYANGAPHLGHVLNKHLKDVLARSFSKKGSTMWWAGWDCHGLPVELAAQKENPLDPKYRLYAHSQVLRQKDVFEKQGWMLDTLNMWTTMDPTYEAKTFSVFQKLFNSGYVYLENTSVPWCTSCKSTLANAEHEDHATQKTSHVVPFDLLDGSKLLSWTTTPWTLPLHNTLFVHPDCSYRALLWDNETCYVSEDTYDLWLGKLGAKPTDLYKQGQDFVGETYVFPWGQSTVRPSSLVQPKGGTGVLHCVPGLSELDTLLGKEHGLAMSNHLQEDGALLHSPMAEQNDKFYNKKSVHVDVLNHFAFRFDEAYTQTEAYCWRHKTPLVTRPSRQVYLNLEKAKEKALAYVEEMTFVPETGKNRLLAHMNDRTHWCVSRQRSWGVPLALLLNEDGQFHPKTEWFMDKAKELLAVGGVEHWHAHKHEFVPEDATLVDDVLDVWFDSGVLPQFLGRQGMALEGSDQHRGWFQSCLWVSAMLGSGAPFSLVATHGFVVDHTGEKYSKSKTNQKGKTADWFDMNSDVVRLWAIGGSFYQDRQWTKDAVEQATHRYAKLRNTLRFLLANQTPNHVKDPNKPLNPYDAYWVLETRKDLLESLELLRACKFHEALLLLSARGEMLSSVYFQALKDRLYCAKENSEDRWSAEEAVHALLSDWLSAMSVFCPRAYEEAKSHAGHSGELSTDQLNDYANYHSKVTKDMKRMVDLKQQVNLVLEKKNLGSRGKLLAMCAPFSCSERMAADYLDVGEVVYSETEDLCLDVSPKALCPRCRRPGTLNGHDFCETCQKRQDA